LLGSHRQRNLATESPCSVIWVRAPSAPWMSILEPCSAPIRQR
jgi:hypothetical protein